MGKRKVGKELLETGLEYLGKTKVSPFKYRQELIKNKLVSLRKANPEMTFSEMGAIISKDFSKKNLRPLTSHMARDYARKMKLPKAEEPKTFTHQGETYLRTEGVKTYYPDPTRASGVHYRWEPNAIKGKKERPHLVQQPWVVKQQAELDEIKGVMKKMDPDELRYTSGPELVELMKKKLPKISRDPNSLVRMKNEILGGGTKGAGLTKLKDESGNPIFSGEPQFNLLLPKSKVGIEKFWKTMKANTAPGINVRSKLKRHLDRMFYTAKLKKVPEEEVVKQLTKTDYKKLGEIVGLRAKFTELVRIAKKYGIDLPTVQIAHKEAVARNWRKAFDVDNLYFADSKGNQYLQDDIEKQIDILNDYLRGKKNKFGRVEVLPTGEKRVVLNKERRKEHMEWSWKDRSPAEIQKDLEKNRLRSIVEGVEYGAKMDPNDPLEFKRLYDEMGEQVMAMEYPYGKMAARGGIVNGYSKGGSIKKLLDETIGMMSRRKFLKGMGATAAHAAMPKAAMKITGPVVKKVAHDFAPPWVNGMLSALKDVPITTKTVFRMGNNSQVQKIGSKKIKLYGGEEGTESYFRVKTSLDTALDDAEIKIPKDKWFPPDAIGSRPKSQWDDITLTEEPGQKTITFNNKAYDGNDQHIVIDTKNKETRFVDDNWHMEAGGEDIAKDDWIEWTMDTDKKKLAKSMGLAKGDVVDDKMVDEWSVNGMTSEYGDIFEDYVDSFTPFGNIFGTVQRALNQLKPKPKFEEIKSAKPQEMTKKYRDMDEMEWEGQFRGGQGMHGYKKGGLQRGHHQKGRQPKYNTEKLMNAIGMAETSPAYMQRFHPGVSRLEYKSPAPSNAYGQYGLRKENYTSPMIYYNDDGSYKSTSTSRSSAGYRMPLLSEAQWNKAMATEAGQRNLSQMYLQNMLSYYQDNPSKMIYGKDPYYEALLRYGPSDTRSTGDYFKKVMGFYNKGGIARRPNAVPPTSVPDPYATLIDESVAQIRSNPSEFMGTQFIQKFSKGGFVRKNAPKVIAKLTNYRPKLTMAEDLKIPKKKRITEPQIKVEETIEEPGAMFWGSREKIIGAPSEAMTGTQWLTYMKLGKHGILNPRGFPIIKDMELNDTSLAPWLSRMGNKTVSKESLVKQFDDMAPTMDVVALGDATGVNLIDKVSRRLKKIDTQAIRNPQIKGFYDYMKTVMPQLKESLTSTESKGIIKSIDDMVYNNFGIKDALTEGVPQRFPFEIKEILQSLSTAFGKRTAGFKKYKRSTQHEGTQMMEGGDNYREFLFRYKPGSLRSNEPQYRYAHDFNLSDADRFGGVVHTRTSDRGDEFGRRLLHIEEIQSDMHQKVNAAQRQVKKQIAEWEKQGLKPHEAYLKLSTAKRKEFDKLTAESKYAPRGDLKEEIGTANEQHFALVKAKIEDLLAQPQTKQTVTRLTKLKRERTKIRKMIEEEKAKMAEGSHSGIPQGPLSKTEDYNEFIMKYLLRVAREGGYDGITINTAAIKNKGLNVTNKDYRGNLVAYGPMAKGAMEKAAKKSGAKFMKTYIKDGDKKVWEVPMILFKENKAAQAIIDKGLPIYKKGGIVKK